MAVDGLEVRLGSLRKLQVVVSVSLEQHAECSGLLSQLLAGIQLHRLEQPKASQLGLHQRSVHQQIQSVEHVVNAGIKVGQ
jgi:hypothetical protein